MSLYPVQNQDYNSDALMKHFMNQSQEVTGSSKSVQDRKIETIQKFEQYQIERDARRMVMK